MILAKINILTVKKEYFNSGTSILNILTFINAT